jgi:hypothetical protein
MKKHVSKPMEVGVIKSTAVFILFIWISFLDADAQTQTFNYESFKASLKDTIILTSEDSSDVMKFYAGNFEKYYAFRLSLIKKNKKDFTWERASFYLNEPVANVKQYAKQLDIDSAYYLYAFMVNDEIKHPLKNKIINNVRKEFYNLKQDKAIFEYDNDKLLNSFFSYRSLPRMEKQHKIIHQIKNKPTIALIEQVFLVKQDDLKLEMRQDSLQLKQIIINPSSAKKSFDDLMELSKTRYKAMYPDKKDVSDMNSYRYYLYRINDYSFNAAGGYGLN